MSETFVGLDVGSSTCKLSAMTKDGRLVVERTFDTSEQNFIKEFKALPGEVHLHLQILEQQDVELSRILHKAHATRIDDGCFVFDIGIVPLVAGGSRAQEQTIGHLHDVGFVKHRYFFSLPLRRVSERPPRDAFATGFRRHLQGVRHFGGRN